MSFLTLLGYSHQNKGYPFYGYRCDLCGNLLIKRKRSPEGISCGCHKSMIPKKDLTGELVNKIRIKGYVGRGEWRIEYLCGCEENRLLSRVTSCKSGGLCEKHRIRISPTEKHGNATRAGETKEYTSWCNMRRRCYDDTHNRSAYYKGCGIDVCERWLEGFKNFLEDMGSCPEGFSLERLDVKKGYSPCNCVWADNIQQANNKTNTIRVRSPQGSVMSLKYWCDILDVNYKSAYYRYRYKNEDVKLILGCGYSIVT